MLYKDFTGIIPNHPFPFYHLKVAELQNTIFVVFLTVRNMTLLMYTVANPLEYLKPYVQALNQSNILVMELLVSIKI